ncbi:MAG: YXWGXW repeat-containing protein [Deltaproteobacteria bacterium]|nr:YXWGXW repeat-containing protein [Deltaproteobacteria bacterium]
MAALAACQVTVIRDDRRPVAAAGYAPPRAVAIAERPPPPEIEERPSQPDEGRVWIAGHWDWVDGRFVWVAGRWSATRPGYQWVEPRVRRAPRGTGWFYIRGHWRPR